MWEKLENTVEEKSQGLMLIYKTLKYCYAYVVLAQEKQTDGIE